MKATRGIKPCPECPPDNAKTIRSYNQMCARCRRRLQAEGKVGRGGGLTPEQMAKKNLCGAKTTNGDPCRNLAGYGTDHLGIGACKFHGGKTKPHRQRAVKLTAQAEMVTLGAPLDIKPHEALLGVLRATAGHVAWLNTEVGRLNGLADDEGATLVRLYSQERDRLTVVAKACLDAGISKIEVELNQRTTEQVAGAVNAAIKSVDGLSDKQREQFGLALRQELAQLQTQAATDEGLEPIPTTGGNT